MSIPIGLAVFSFLSPSVIYKVTHNTWDLTEWGYADACLMWTGLRKESPLY